MLLCVYIYIAYGEIEMEEAAVLYNLATAHSYIGSQCDIDTEEGLKLGVQHFQLAAGALTQIRDTCVAEAMARVKKPVLTPDLSEPGLNLVCNNNKSSDLKIFEVFS